MVQMVLAERQQMQDKNHALQHRLADVLRSKAAAAAAQRDEQQLLHDERSTAEQEQRYLKYMGLSLSLSHCLFVSLSH